MNSEFSIKPFDLDLLLKFIIVFLSPEKKKKKEKSSSGMELYESFSGKNEDFIYLFICFILFYLFIYFFE